MSLNWQENKKKKIIIGVVVIVLVGWFLSNQDRVVVPLSRVNEGGFAGMPMAETVQKEDVSFMGEGMHELSAPMARQGAGQVDQVAQEEMELEDRKVVKSGILSLVVDKAEEAAKQVQSIAEEMGGFVESLQVYEISAGRKSGSVTVRVPASRFREAMDGLKDLAINVESETVNAQDVTKQYVDLEANLKNLRAEETQYQEIMKKAEKIEDILQVTQRLSTVRGRIERMEANLNLLKSEVEMSSITVSLMAEGDIEVFGLHWRPLVVVKQSFREMLRSLTGYVDEMVRFVFKLPAMLIWLITYGIGLLIAWKIFKWVRGKWFSS